MDAAMSAERVLRDMAAELVGRDRILSAQQLEPRARHNKMHDALHRADRAVAFGRGCQVALHPESHLAAVASAFISLEHCCLRSRWFSRRTLSQAAASAIRWPQWPGELAVQVAARQADVP